MSGIQLGTGVVITEVFTVNGVPTNGTTVAFEVTDPHGVSVTYVMGVDGEVTHPAAGTYVLTLTPPPLAGTYYYEAVATGTVNATSTGSFTILSSSVDPDESLRPQVGPCQSWADSQDVATFAGNPVDANDVPIDLISYAYAASEILFALSGRLFSGLCEKTGVRPCATYDSCGTQVLSRGHVINWGGNSWNGSPCGCQPLSEVLLSGYPVWQITEVKIDGAVVDPDTYGIRDRRWLVRKGDPVTGDALRWPSCFPAGTLVLTETGMKQIQDVRVGEKVLTHKNRWRRVLWSGQTGESEILSIRGRGGTLNCTPDHPVWAASMHPSGASPSKRVGMGEPDWVPASDLIGRVWATPAYAESLPVPLPLGWRKEELPERFWWFVGRWVGDGWTDTAGRVTLCAGMHEREEVQTVLKTMDWEWRESGGNHEAARWRFNSPELRSWLRQHFGTSAHDKNIPGWMFGADENIRTAFLEGYVSADGYSGEGTRGGHYTSVHTVSRALALGTRILAGTLGHAAVVYTGQANLSIDHATYRANWPETPIGGSRSHSRSDGDHIWNRVKGLSLGEEVVPVYDLTVEEDHSFVADGFVVHNCQRLDLEDTEDGTWSVAYRYGVEPPFAGKLAAAELGAQVYNGLTGGECALPEGTTRVIRQGIVIEKMAFSAWGLQDGIWRTGLPFTDAFLNAWNPTGARRRPVIWSPARHMRYARPAIL